MVAGGGVTSADTSRVPGEDGTAGPVMRRSGDERSGVLRRSSDAPGEDEDGAAAPCNGVRGTTAGTNDARRAPDQDGSAQSGVAPEEYGSTGALR